ncbi:DUF6265 family protein [Algoriphagus namhaensis]|uniref:DUF6265 family protein n=1 Tax=Algoriphagus namhaensis TaxID=915353 RepID=A0ABV8ARM1_9BACT
MKTSLISLCIFFIFNLGQAQVKKLEEGQNPGIGNLDELEWLVGYWEGEVFGGDAEEVWMPAVDGHMIGTFRFWSEGKLVFSEFMNLVQEGDSFTLKLRHYNPDLSAWEEEGEWTEFRLVETGPNSVWFDGLTMIRKGDVIQLHLALTENGKEMTESFTYQKGQF